MLNITHVGQYQIFRWARQPNGPFYGNPCWPLCRHTQASVNRLTQSPADTLCKITYVLHSQVTLRTILFTWQVTTTVLYSMTCKTYHHSPSTTVNHIERYHHSSSRSLQSSLSSGKKFDHSVTTTTKTASLSQL